jgi:serine/threonine protein kinase
MAPEMHRREPAIIQSDLYAVGLVILEMLRGEPVLPPGKMSETEMLDFKLKMVDNLQDFLPEHVRQNDAFVMALRRFLAPEPEDRYAHAQEAESGKEGLLLVHKQLALVGKDTEYGRELEAYLEKLANPLTGEIILEPDPVNSR